MHARQLEPPQSPYILGVSGSPIENSNTDRLLGRVLHSSGFPWMLLKLSDFQVGPCRACLQCVESNRCAQGDDFQHIAPIVYRAKGLAIGCYPPYGSMDAFTKAFLERLYSLRHIKGLNKGKPAVVATTGNARGIRGVEAASEQVAHALGREGMLVLGTLVATGNPNCLVCGYGDSCNWSAIPKIFPQGLSPEQTRFSQVEEQPEIWNKAKELGQELGRQVQAGL